MSPLRSLRARSMLATGAVATLALVAFGLASGWATRQEVQRLLTLEASAADRLEQQVESAMSALEAAASGEADAGRELATPLEIRMEQALDLWRRDMGAGRDHGMVVRLGERTLVSDPELRAFEIRFLRDGTIELKDDDREMVLRVPIRQLELGDGSEARLFPVPIDFDPPGRVGPTGIARSEVKEQFVRAVDRRLVAALALAAAAALILTWTVTSRLMRPVDRLIDVAERLRSGERGLRAELSGDDEIARLGQAFDRMSATFEETEDLRRELVASVAHELRTPLAAMRCQLEAVQDGLMPFDSRLAGSLYEETRHLEHLVADLQDLALAEAGQIRLELGDIGVKAAVIEAVEEILPALAAESSSESPPRTILEISEKLVARADATRLRQILHNLLSNALRHTPRGGAITIGAEAMGPAGEAVEATDGASAVKLWVADTGPGIPEQHLPHVFERFYRADPSRRKATGGAGLGLSIVRRLAELHGGSARIENLPSRHSSDEGPAFGGSKVTITLSGPGGTSAELPPSSAERPSPRS